MSSFVHQLSIILIITVLPSLHHARESQFFGKIPSTAANDVVTFPKHPDWLPETGNIHSAAANDVASFPKHPDWLPETGNIPSAAAANDVASFPKHPDWLPEARSIPSSAAANDVASFPKHPDWLPETGNGHGLYGQASGQLRSSDVSAAEFKPQPNKYIPKNYNPESYVTEPEFVAESADFGSNPNNFKNDNSLYDGPQNYQLTPEEKQAEYRNSHYKGGGGDLALISAGLNNRRGEPQGMSDTRRFENGKYHYDVVEGKYSADHPYESVRNGYNGGKNSGGGYEKEDEFVNGENVDFQP